MTTGDIPLNGVFAPNHPLPLIICALLIGVFAGIFLDILSTKDRLFGENILIGHFVDFLTILLCYLLMFICALNFNNGVLRWYHFVCAFVGYRAYLKTFSRPFLRLIGFIYDVAEKIVRFVFKMLLIPLNFFARALTKIYRNSVRTKRAHDTENAYKSELKKYKKAAAHGFYLAPEHTKFLKTDKKDIKKGDKKEKEWIRKKVEKSLQ